MSDNKRYCMGCMKELDPQAIICPHCHYSTGMSNKSSYLNQGHIVADRYLIGKALATANDSVIYIGLDKDTGSTVSVCEFFPNKLVARDTSGSIKVSDDFDRLVSLGDSSSLTSAENILYNEHRVIPLYEKFNAYCIGSDVKEYPLFPGSNILNFSKMR